MYKPVERTRLHEVITDQIEDLIVAQSLRPGDALPPERELARILNVGRPTVRESLGALMQRGLVKVMPGRGAFVAAESDCFLRDSLRLMLRLGHSPRAEFCDARRLLEVELAGRAAQYAQPEDLALMENTLMALEAAQGDPSEYVKAEIEFHSSIVRAAHHKVLGSILHNLQAFVIESVGYDVDRVETIPRIQEAHRAIARAIRAGDVATVRDLMDRHLETNRVVAEQLDRLST